jgi:L-fuculose-phosphate aldolase
MTSPLPQWFIDRMKSSDGDKFHGFWEAMVRQELRADPTLLNNS